MHRLLGLLAVLLGGWIGWVAGAWGGSLVGCVTSAIGSGLGLYFARRFERDYLE
jgi:hypothetical protein